MRGSGCRPRIQQGSTQKAAGIFGTYDFRTPRPSWISRTVLFLDPGGYLKYYIVFLTIFLCATTFARADETCGDGYTLSVFHPSSTVATRGGECYSGYEIYSGSDFRFIPQSTSIVCPAGQHMSGGTCVADTVGNCATGFHDADTGPASAVQTLGGECYSGYQAQQTNRNVAYLIVSPNPTCGSGYYPTPNGCVAHTTGDCPDNYYAVAPTNAFVRMTDDTCPTNYAEYDDTELCKSWPAFMDKPDFCTPQLLCNSGGVALRTSTGINLPIYRERATTTTLNFGFENGGVCYMNMIPGAGANTINIKYNNETYHGVE